MFVKKFGKEWEIAWKTIDSLEPYGQVILMFSGH